MKLKQLLSIFILLIVITIQCSQHVITYQLNNERFGDQLITYIKAETVAYAYNLPIQKTPFLLSDQLKIKSAMSPYQGPITKKCINNARDISALTPTPTLFMCNVMLNAPHIWQSFSDDMYAFIHQHPDLHAQLQKQIAPQIPFTYSSLPTDRFCVAVHIRTGGGFDKPLASQQLYNNQTPVTVYTYPDIPHDQFGLQAQQHKAPYGSPSDKRWPLKFPPEQYYVDQIQRVAQLIAPEHIHVHIFTDDQNPTQLMQRIQHQVNNPTITYSCRQADNHHSKNILYDFFYMTQFDGLIMPWSNFSRCVQLIGDFKLIIHPYDMYWEDNTLYVHKIVLINHLP